MSLSSKDFKNLQARKHRTRTKLATHQELPRMSVHRSLRHISVQIIDDKQGLTLASAHDTSVEGKGNKTQIAEKVGQKIAELALSKKISQVRFDRGGYRFHGRIAALANAARNKGLQF